MKRKIWIALLSAAMLAACAFGFAACGGENEDPQPQVWTMETVYAEAQELGYTGTLEEFIATVSGKDGQDGVGISSVELNEVGDLIISFTDGSEINLGSVVGTPGANGQDGVSIVGASVNADGNLILSLSDGSSIDCGRVVGADGQDGMDGQDGQDGTDGQDGQDGMDGQDGQDGTDGQDGRGISQAYINEEGKLTIEYSDGTSAVLDTVVGADGKDGDGIQTVHIDENGHLIVQLTNGSELNLGNVVGKDGQDGEDGVDGTDGDSVSGASINNSGELILTFVSGKQIIVGNVVGSDGENGADGIGIQTVIINERGELVVTLTNDSELNLGNVVGKDGQDGEDGASITKAEINAEGHLILTFSDSHTLDCGSVKGEDGVGVVRVFFNESGELIVSLSDGTEVNCGKIPVCVHQYSDWEDGIAPTCTSMGYQSRTCSICGNVEYLFLEETGHIAQEYIKTQSSHSYWCAQCNVFVEELHNFQEDGSCMVCGYEADYSLGLEYHMIGDGTSYRVSGIGSFQGTDLVIPAEYRGIPVTSIEISAFEYCSGLTEIVIPDSVTSIGDAAFRGCSGLASVTIGNGVTWIGNYAFYNCSGLTGELIIPNGMTSIGNYTFYGCSGLTGELIIPDSMTSIGDYTFYGCSGLTEIVIPDSVTSIGDYTFYGCSGLTGKLIIPDSVTSIGSSAFYKCSGLTEITIPDSVTSIARGAFRYCSGLTEMTIPFVNTYFGAIFGAYVSEGHEDYVPSSLKIVTITGGTSINDYAFRDCSGLTEITIPDSVTSIGSSAFEDCSGLTEITIPDSVTSIGYGAFSGCSGLTKITIPDGVTSIGISAFSGCSGLTEITIPDGVTSIGISALEGCSRLTKITIPFVGAQNKGVEESHFGSIFGSAYSAGNDAYVPISLETVIITGGTSIGSYAFERCSGLTEITILDSVTSIGNHAFSGCSGLTEIFIPDSVTSIESNAFRGCSGLTIYCEVESHPSGWGSDWNYDNCPVVWNCNNNEVANDGCIYAVIDGIRYALQDGIATVAEQSTALSGAISVPDSVTYHEVSYSVTSIGDYAFRDCSGLTEITIPDSVTSIGSSAFRDCSGLESITVEDGNPVYHSAGNCLIETESKTLIAGCQYSVIPTDGSVTSIGERTFYNCSGLTEITIPDSVTSIGRSAFSGCSGLTSITIPDSVTSIGEGVFSGCSGLTEITIPDSITSIGWYAFSGCSGLTSITIPDGVTSIGDYAFSGCSGLTIYSETASKPSGWNSNWNYSNCPIVWNCNNNNVAEDGYIYAVIDGVRYALQDGIATVAEQSTTLSGAISVPESVAYQGGSYSVESIGDSAFNSCSGLTEITIPDSVTSIGDYAFSGCSGLTIYCEVESQPSGWNSNWNYSNCPVVWNCSNNDVANDSYIYIVIDGIRYALKDGIAKVVRQSTALSGAISIPESVTYHEASYSVTSIGNYAFRDCIGLTEITIPNGVTSIGNYAFRDCIGLTEITIPDSVASIGDYAFYNCSGLTSVYYMGTAEEWEGISIYAGNAYFTSATRYYYIENEADVPQDGGNYWHYDTDGVTPVVWE